LELVGHCHQLLRFGQESCLSDIFLSYSREDQVTARRFAEAFGHEGFSVWWDTTLHSGDAYDKVTEQALKEAHAVVVLWSEKSVDSRWVRSEATVGARRGTLVPVMIEPCERPVMFELTHTADLTHWTGDRRDKAWLAYLADVRRYVEGKQPPLGQPAMRAQNTVGAGGVSAPTINRRTAIGGAVALAAAAGGYAAWQAGLFGSAGSSGSSVAVLPFSNLSGDATQSYLSDGLAAEIRAALARNSLLQVVAQTSSDSVRDHKEDAKQISRKLGVSFLLDGNVRRSGDTLRIVAELINGRTGFTKWTQTFDRSMRDVFAVQSEIAGAVASALSAAVAPNSSATVGDTRSVAAYEAFLRGKELFTQASGEDTDRASAAAFEQAIGIDANFGAAHAARSRALTAIANQYSQGAMRRELYDAAIEAANTAIRLAPDLADGHSALGFALFSGRLDVRGARAPYDRSYALGAGDADVLNRFALYSARTGRFDEARVAIERAASLDPLNARIFRSVGGIAYAARHYQESIPSFDQALQLNPRLDGVWAAKGSSQLLLGQLEQARKSFSTERSSLFGLVGIAIIDWKQHHPDAAHAALARMIEENGDNSLYQQAEVYAQWEDRDRAMTTLLRARETGDAGLGLMRNDPLLDPIRKEPQFQKLLNDLGFA
jgi:TolB-like protein/Tfp pilus assembly protein PilF